MSREQPGVNRLRIEADSDIFIFWLTQETLSVVELVYFAKSTSRIPPNQRRPSAAGAHHHPPVHMRLSTTTPPHALIYANKENIPFYSFSAFPRSSPTLLLLQN
jgi:hypothetical protein